MCLNYLANDESSRGRYDWALKQANGDSQVAAKNLSDILIKTYHGKPSFDWDFHLDRFLLDYEIKVFLEDFYGAQSWKDVPEAAKRACYKYYPGTKKLPVWEDIRPWGKGSSA